LKNCLFWTLETTIKKEKQWLDPCLRMIEHWVYVGLKTSWGERGYMLEKEKQRSSWKMVIVKKKENFEKICHHLKQSLKLQRKRKKRMWHVKRITKSEKWGKVKESEWLIRWKYSTIMLSHP
jgi:hypothetical protein